MKRKKILFFVVGSMISSALLELGRSIGAQFRNARLVDPDNIEPCDMVAGQVIPPGYEKFPVHPEASPEVVAELTGSTPPPTVPDGPPGAFMDASGGSNEGNSEEIPDDSESEGEDTVEISLEYLNSLENEELIALADEEGLELSKNQMKSREKTLKALVEFFELQE